VLLIHAAFDGLARGKFALRAAIRDFVNHRADLHLVHDFILGFFLGAFLEILLHVKRDHFPALVCRPGGRRCREKQNREKFHASGVTRKRDAVKALRFTACKQYTSAQARTLREITGEYFCYALGVRRALILTSFLFLAGACAQIAARASQQTPQQNPPQPAIPQQATPPQQPVPPQNSAAPQTPVQPAGTLRMVVLDPAHGGADTGARGPSGVAEKDLVLDFARAVGDALRAQGFQVVMTRHGDTDPSFDDRAAIVNAQKDAIFISLHVGSTGPAGTVRTYTYLFPSAPSTAAASSPAAPAAKVHAGGTQSATAMTRQAAAPPAGFLLWSEAQKPYVQQSRKLGDLIQVEVAQIFPGSPEISWSEPVYGLRSIAAPAVAVEISSVAMDPQKLEAMAPGLADEITRAVQAYKTIYPPGGK
jgi:N-acetylmuramoyl-L-alanine amidase